MKDNPKRERALTWVRPTGGEMAGGPDKCFVWGLPPVRPAPTVSVSSLAEQVPQPGGGRRLQRVDLNDAVSGRVPHRNRGLLGSVRVHTVEVDARDARRLLLVEGATVGEL